MTERGLGPGELLGFNPRLVYLSMSAAGADGPLAGTGVLRARYCML